MKTVAKEFLVKLLVRDKGQILKTENAIIKKSVVLDIFSLVNSFEIRNIGMTANGGKKESTNLTDSKIDS